MSKKYLTTKAIKLFAAAAICLVLVFLNPGKFFTPIRGFFLSAAYPLQKTFYITSKKIKDFAVLISSISDLKKENEQLLKENRNLFAQIADIEGQKKENEVLRRQLELAPRQKYALAAAFVIGQDSRGGGYWIMADKGKKDGISLDMPVIVFDGILVGKVAEVYEKSSKIILLTDSSSFVNALDLTTGARGILSGEYGLGLNLGMVAQTDVLNAGDDVVTSGLGGVFPKGLLIGKIQQIENTKDKLFQQAMVNAKVEYADLDMVFIIKNSL